MFRPIHTVLAAAAVLGLTLTGCTPEARGQDETPPVGTAAQCTGIEVIVDFGELHDEHYSGCLETDEVLTAAEVFADSQIELTENSTIAGAICRVQGWPKADETLEYDGETYVETCEEMGPVWAYWGLFINSGDAWEYAQEGAATQEVKPGEGIAFSWQFGDTTEPRLPHL